MSDKKDCLCIIAWLFALTFIAGAVYGVYIGLYAAMTSKSATNHGEFDVVNYNADEHTTCVKTCFSSYTAWLLLSLHNSTYQCRFDCSGTYSTRDDAIQDLMNKYPANDLVSAWYSTKTSTCVNEQYDDKTTKAGAGIFAVFLVLAVFSLVFVVVGKIVKHACPNCDQPNK